MAGFIDYLRLSRERHILAYRAVPWRAHDERSWHRARALHYARLLREHRA